FTYNGRQYVATAAAKDIARNYMLRDDIDLTAAQVSKAIDMCFGSIARGIAEGYLVPYGNGSSDAPAPSGGTSETTYKTVVGSKEYEEIEVQIDELMDALDEAVASANTASEAATKASGNAEAATEAANAAASAAEKAADAANRAIEEAQSLKTLCMIAIVCSCGAIVAAVLSAVFVNKKLKKVSKHERA
ncbi:MAG: hypothetical protein IKD62_06250, partial [Oscillospiraceae bacterium]|nr:hypothetical protein [Oscillospiraceae bacterium]